MNISYNKNFLLKLVKYCIVCVLTIIYRIKMNIIVIFLHIHNRLTVKHVIIS